MANFTDETKLIPTYVNADYTTVLNKFIDLLRQDDTFKDFNYHGSNIAMITELMAYFADFTNFYTNMVAKNVYLDTADVFETVHRLVTQKGYIPLGWLSSEASISLKLEDDTLLEGNRVTIDGWQTINTGAVTEDNKPIYYTLTESYTETVTGAGGLSFALPFRQGTIDELTYLGSNMVDNLIVLPFRNYDSGMYPFDVPSIQVSVNGSEWIRVHDFYDHLSGLIPDERNIYTFYYDKYERYVISFASSFEVPNPSDTIRIRILKSLGDDGIIHANTIDTTAGDIESLQIENITNLQMVGGSYESIFYSTEEITEFTNHEASVGGATPETVLQLKSNANANMHTQFRNVTKQDYKFHMEMRSDVVKGAAWGEQEVDPANTIEYNKVYCAVVPRSGNDYLFIGDVLQTSELTWVDTDVDTLSAGIQIPNWYTTAFTNNLLRYLEPRKMISVYEFPVPPQMVYFRFDIGLRVNRSYRFTDVLGDVRDKLLFYFDSFNREFHEEINFMDIHNFIFDMSKNNDDEYFLNIKGLDNIVIREQSTYTIIPAPSASNLSGSTSGASFDPTYSLSDYLSGAAYDEWIQDSKLAMGTMTEEVSAWTGHFDVFEPNTTANFPQYTQESRLDHIDNRLRPVQLGYNQFPMLSLEMCRFYNESS